MQNAIEQLSNLRPNATFLSLRNYTSDSGEVSDVQISFHISYGNALRKSVGELEAMSPATLSPVQLTARDELIASFLSSIEKMTTVLYEKEDDDFERFYNADGEHIKGIRVHKGTGNLHIYGLLLRKTVHVKGEHKEVKSSPKTIEKNKLRAKTTVGKFRAYVVAPDKVEEIRVENLTVLPL